MIPTKNNSYTSQIIHNENEIMEKINKYKNEGKKIGFCTGSFDLLHPGHIRHLVSAKKMCDVLIVGVARNEYTATTRKTTGRPIFNQEVRAYAISQLKPVDMVIINENSMELLKLFKPHIYIKGKDHANANIEELPLTNQLGIEMYFTSDEKLSTTNLINYIKCEVKNKD
jgi:rfaE bifunctional protein nucleotidyltransferase chain/domain